MRFFGKSPDKILIMTPKYVFSCPLGIFSTESSRGRPLSVKTYDENNPRNYGIKDVYLVSKRN